MDRNRSLIESVQDAMIALVIGLVATQIVLGLEKLNPLYTSWLLLPGSDYSYHYLAWEYFKDTPWSWPLGKIQGYAYPMVNSIMYTDSIPLFALFFKLFKGILPEDFQYFGLWYACCYVLNTYLGIKILRQIGWQKPLAYIGSVFFTGAVVLVARFGHTALCGQWVLLWALLIFLRRPTLSVQATFLTSGLLVFITSLIHPYLLFMVLGLVSAIVFQLRYEQLIRWKDLYTALLSMIVLSLAGWAASGAFLFKGQLSEGLGRYSANLNTLVNAWDVGRLGPGFPYWGDGQGEGIGYLGLGILTMLLCILLVRLSRIKMDSKVITKKQSKKLNWFFIICMVFFVFALSPKWTLGSHLIIDWRYNDYISRTFRGTGRFIWPLYYFILYWTFDRLYRFRLGSKVYYALFIACLTLQMLDLQPLWKRNQYVDLRGQVLPYIDQIKHIVSVSNQVIVYPPFSANIADHCDYIYFTDITQHYQKPISTGYGARFPESIGQAFRDSLADLTHYFDLHPKNILITSTDSLSVHKNLISTQGGRSYQFEHYRIYAPPALVSMIDSAIVPSSTWHSIEHQSELSFLNWLHVHQDHYVIGVVQQEGISNLHDREELKTMGAAMDSLRFGDSWTFVIHEKQFIHQKYGRSQMVKDTFDLPCSTLVPVYLYSGGHSAGKNESSILIRNEEWSLGSRGINLVVVDSCGAFLDKINVDGYVSDEFISR